jgi:hypothetical protein
MKKVHFVLCCQCPSVKLYNLDRKESFWQKLKPYEELAIKQVQASDVLTVLFGATTISYDYCDECLENKRNAVGYKFGGQNEK